MLWIDYNIESFPDGSFAVKGDWEGEVMGKDVNGNAKSTCLYKPGDVFIVNEDGWLIKSDELSAMVIKYEKEKNEM